MKPIHANWRQRKPLRLFHTTCTWSTWSNGKTTKLMQSSIFMWRFRCSSRHSFFKNSQLCSSRKVDNNGYWKIIWECNSSYSSHFYILFIDSPSMKSATNSKNQVLQVTWRWWHLTLLTETVWRYGKFRNSVGERPWSSDLLASNCWTELFPVICCWLLPVIYVRAKLIVLD